MATRQEILALDIKVRGGAKARQELDTTADATRRAARTTERSNRRAESSTTALRKSVARLRNVTLLTSFAITATVLAVDNFAKRAEKISSVSRAFETLSNRVNESSDAILSGMVRASQGLVTNFDLMQQANNALILGLPVTAESMERLTDSATRLGRALGIDTTRAIESIVTGIGRQSRLMLDNIGIIANFELAHLRTAAALGKTVEELTSAESKASDWNHVVDLAAQKSALLSDEVLVLSDRYLTLSTRVKNTANEFLGLINTIGSGRLETQLNSLILQRETREAIGTLGGRTSGTSAMRRDLALLDEQIMAVQRQIEQRQADVEHRKQAAQVIDELQRQSQAAEIALLQTRENRKKLTSDLIGLELELAAITLPGAGSLVGGDSLTGDPSRDPLAMIEEQLALEDMFHSISLAATEEFEENVTAIQDRQAAVRIAIAQNEQRQKIAFQQQLSSQAFALAGALFGHDKLFAIAESVINTQLAVTKTLASLPYPANIAAAAHVKLLGILSTATIAATAFAGGGGGGGAGASGGGGFASAGTPFTPAPTGAQRGPVEIRVFLEGEGFFQISPEELAQRFGEEYARQAGAAGLLVGNEANG